MSSSPLPAYRQLADRLRESIVTGRLAPGERLPGESELAEQFGVSRSTVREALRALATQHLVETTRGVTGGSFIRVPQPGQVSDSLETSLGILTGAEELTVGELLEARELLEVPAARLAAKRRSDDQLSQLRACLPGAGEEDSFEINRAFHVILLEASGNRLLVVMTRPVFVVLETEFLYDAVPGQFWEQVATDHRRLAEAVESGDADLAAAEMTDHLAHLRPIYETMVPRRRG